MGIPGWRVKEILKHERKLKLQDVAAALGMTVQNLAYHFAKEEADYEFLLKLKDKLKIDLLSGESATKKAEPSTNQDKHGGEQTELKVYGQRMFKGYAEFFGYMTSIVDQHTEKIESIEERIDFIADELIDLTLFREKIEERMQALEGRRQA